MPQALFVPDDSQLMSYLGQSTRRIECVHREKKRGGRGRGDEKKKSVIWLVIQQMLQICSRASRFLLGVSDIEADAGEERVAENVGEHLNGF